MSAILSFFKILTLDPVSCVTFGLVWLESSHVTGQPAAAAKNVGPVSLPIAPIALVAVVARQLKSLSEKSIIDGANVLIILISTPSGLVCP